MKSSTVYIFLTLLCVSPLVAQTTIKLSNSSEVYREDESFVIPRQDLNSEKIGLLPAIKGENGSWIPSQVDDLDGDGEWDELAFTASFAPQESKQLTLVWVAPNDYPLFAARTNVRYGKMTSPGNVEHLTTDLLLKENLPRGENYPYQTDGPAWENDKGGFRHYIDGRNVRDYFGKRTNQMVMDTVGIRADGTPGDTYHTIHWWGRDIMSGARSFGLGGIALLQNDTLVRMGVLQEQCTDVIDSTRYTQLCKGAVRSIFTLDFYGWDVGSTKVDVHQQMTIWAGKYGYENRITTSPLPIGTSLVTGIVNNFNDAPYMVDRAMDWHIMATHDKQSYDKEWWLGLAVVIADTNWTGNLYEAPQEGEGITTTWYTSMLPNKDGLYHYYCYGGWELNNINFVQRDYFMNTVKKDFLYTPIKLEIVNHN